MGMPTVPFMVIQAMFGMGMSMFRMRMAMFSMSMAMFGMRLAVFSMSMAMVPTGSVMLVPMTSRTLGPIDDSQRLGKLCNDVHGGIPAEVAVGLQSGVEFPCELNLEGRVPNPESLGHFDAALQRVHRVLPAVDHNMGSAEHLSGSERPNVDIVYGVNVGQRTQFFHQALLMDMSRSLHHQGPNRPQEGRLGGVQNQDAKENCTHRIGIVPPAYAIVSLANVEWL
mmetsp:Transcript_3159/g.7395  ORF Transcript_3159/g.7395 Transcript_3159/m.7395 type:complete len:225 (+) Transcript_3159:282-956(+)